MNKIVTPIFEHAHRKITKITFGFPEIAPACKKKISLFHLFVLEIQSILESLQATPMPNQKFFDQLLILVNLYQHVKNQAVSLICSGDMVV